MRRLTALLAASFVCLPHFLQAQAVPAKPAPAKPAPDVLIFSNGDQLTGQFERAVGGSVIFKSDMAGELTIGFDKIKELRSGSGKSEFAVLRKGAPFTKVPAPTGTLEFAGGNIVVTPGTGPAETVAAKDVAYVIDKPTYEKAIKHQAGPLQGWNGNATGGATIVRSTETGTTLSAALHLIRAIPLVPYLPARNRTLFNVAESYGKLSTPVIPQTVPASPPSVVKTNIFHADGERDEYFSPRLYALGETAFDHNFSQGLYLQQVYGGGVGWTPVKNAKQQLDLKADVHYEEQEFMQQTGTAYVPSLNLIGTTLAEAYHRNLPYKLVITESGNYLPAWNDATAYSANATATLALPVFKRLSASFSTTDNYLNNPSPGYKKNSYQLITGINYALR